MANEILIRIAQRCGALKNISNDIKLQPIYWQLNLENSFAWAFEQVEKQPRLSSVNFWADIPRNGRFPLKTAETTTQFVDNLDLRYSTISIFGFQK